MPTRPPTHRPVGAPKSEAERRQRVDRVRGSSNARLYGYRWQKERLAHLQANPLCVPCQAEGKVTGATVVDHAVAHRGDPLIFWDKSRWVSCCQHHHDTKTEDQERQGWGGIKTSKPPSA